MLLPSHTIEAVEVDSDRDLPCGRGSSVGMPESALLGISHFIVRTEVRLAPPVPAGPVQEGWGFRFLCCCPRVVPLRTNRISDGGFARQGICLLTADFPELC